MRTHPDDGQASNRVVLEKAEALMMQDGEIVFDWPRVVADSTTVGLNGRDTGSLLPDVWYEVHPVRNSSTDARGVILHRHKSYVLDQAQESGVSVLSLRDNAVRQALGQEFTPGLCGPLEVLDIAVRRYGNPQGGIWMTIESMAGDLLATSDKIDVRKLALGTVAFNLRLIFRAAADLDAGTKYRMRMYGDYPISATDCIQWFADDHSSYSGGAPSSFDGTTWNALTNDFAFKAYITQHDSPIELPSGYDQHVLSGFMYTNRDSAKFDPMVVNGRRHTWGIRSTGKYPGTNGRMDMEDFTNTMPIVKDSHIAFPHGLDVTMEVAVTKNQPGIVIVANSTRGYRCTAGDYDNAVTAAVKSAGDPVYAGSIETEYGSFYACTDAGAATVFVPSWTW